MLATLTAETVTEDQLIQTFATIENNTPLIYHISLLGLENNQK